MNIGNKGNNVLQSCENVYIILEEYYYYYMLIKIHIANEYKADSTSTLQSYYSETVGRMNESHGM